MKIRADAADHVVVVQPGKRLDVESTPEFESTLEALLGEGGQHVVIDMSNVQYVSSIGLAACLKGAKLAQAKGARIALTDLGPMAQELMHRSGIVGLFATFASADDAIASLRSLPATPPSPHGVVVPAASPETHGSALSLVEEILLLAIDEHGDLVDLPRYALDHALAGAVLMDLCMRRRVDGDLEKVRVVDATPIGDNILDPALAAIASTEATHDARRWISQLVEDGETIRELAFDRLITRGVLRRDGNRLMWALGRRRYPIIDQREQREVRDRVIGIIQSHEIPSPHDVVIIALADACAVFDAVLGMDDMLDARPRIAELARMDLIAQSMQAALLDMQASGRRDPAIRTGIYSPSTKGAAR